MIRRGLLLAILFASPSFAHQASDSYLALKVSAGHVDGSWDLPLRDLHDQVGLDRDGDGSITWGELRASASAIATNALSNLDVGCPLRVTDLLVRDHGGTPYAVLRLAGDCVPTRIRYSWMFDKDPLHRGFVRIESGGTVRTDVLRPGHTEVVLDGSSTPFTSFVADGIRHIWSGLDHILFLLALLLPAVLRREDGRWVPVERLGPALGAVLKVVTAFTVAHSLTLTLATLGVLRLPTRLVESAIALSVLLAALNNLWPLLRGRAWAFAFAFGLVHGLGFAGALLDLSLPRAALGVALFGFNVGVELGQLAIVVAAVSLTFAARRTVLYRRVVVGAGSLLIAVLSLGWLAQRAFDVRL